MRNLKRVRVQFNPLDPRSTAAREFLARVTTAKAAKSNPECAVEPRVRNDAAPPVVAVEFASGARDHLNNRSGCAIARSMLASNASGVSIQSLDCFNRSTSRACRLSDIACAR